MTARSTSNRTGRGLDGLLLVAALLVIASAAAWLIVGRGGSGGASSSAIETLLGLAADAQSVAAGDDAALARFAQGAQRLRSIPVAGGEDLARLLANTEVVLKSRQAIADAAAATRDARGTVQRILEVSGPLSSALTGQGGDSAARPLERFELRAQRVQFDVAALAAGTADPGETAQRLAENADYLEQVVKGLRGADSALGLPRVTGAEPLARLKTLEGLIGELNAAVRRVVEAAPALPAARTAAQAVAQDARALAVSGRAGTAGTNHGATIALALAGGALVLLAVVWFGVRRLTATVEKHRQAMEAQRKENDRNQQAILRLLDELSSLADGDLTVQATVTEDITGAIADSINYAVDALRGLVTTINDSAIQLESATKQTQALAQHLAKSSGAQSKQIASATEHAAAMAASAEEVSGNAERAADVARHSVDIAHKGGDAVRRTIDGMNAIRETIQETSKRIKRLGESSQEIGNIVELINDIAEQTNILALNASIQASMAGEAGRGFAVVADEVQRLAERAANATKQIEVLVRTIQTDTTEAVVSMERSTTDVVGGALLAENAGAALEEIEQVSNQIASLVQNISASARQQTAAAQNIARNMQVLKEISAQTAESTSATSVAIAKLAELSAGLRRAASGFRLPGNTDTATSGVVKRLDDSGVRQAVAAAGSSS
ncbi:MAG: methyl-accepting chemotaxis protein [Pseudomonadota bacterium]|jgi:Methyl-accepting chemotaxis protein